MLRSPAYGASVDFAELLDLYRATAHRNPRTREVRMLTARQFVDWCQANELPFPSIAEVEAYRYLEFRRSAAGNSESTISSKVNGLKHFYRWMRGRGFVEVSPFESIVASKQSPQPRSTVKLEELRRLWIAAPSPTHRTVIGLLGFTGLGIEEIVELDVSDLHWDESGYYSLRVRSRPPTRGHIQVLLPPEVAAAVRQTVGERRTGPLVPRADQPAKRLNRGIILRMTRTCGKRAGIALNVTPGMLAFSVRALAIDNGFSYIGVVRAIGEMHDAKGRRWIEIGSFRSEQHAAIRLGRLVFDDPESTLGRLNEASVLLNESSLSPGVAVMAAGAALERHLRELCAERGLLDEDQAGKERTLTSYAQELIKDRAIHRSVHKEIELIAGWRNDAAHGWFERVDQPIAEKTISQVRKIVEKHPLKGRRDGPSGL